MSRGIGEYIIKNKKKIYLTADKRKLPFPKDWQGDRTAYRVTADNKAPNHSNTKSPAYYSPKYKKYIDQIPYDVGTGGDSGRSVRMTKDIKLAKINSNSVVLSYYEDKNTYVELFRLHVDAPKGIRVGQIIKAGNPVYGTRGKDAHVHVAHSKNGKAIAPERVMAWVVNPVKKPSTKPPTKPPTTPPTEPPEDDCTKQEAKIIVLSQRVGVLEKANLKLEEGNQNLKEDIKKQAKAHEIAMDIQKKKNSKLQGERDTCSDELKKCQKAAENDHWLIKVFKKYLITEDDKSKKRV